MKNNTQNTNSTEGKSVEKKSILKKHLSKFAYIVAGLTIVACGSKEEPENIAPTGKITITTSNDDTNTVSGNFTTNDADGNVKSETLRAIATDGTYVDISVNASGDFSETFTEVGKTYNTLELTATDDEGETTTITKTITPITVEAPEQPLLLEITNLNVNDTTNTISFDANGTDADNDITGYTAFVTTTNGETIDLTIDSDGKVNQKITTIGAYNKLTVIVTNDNDETTTKETDIDLTVEAENAELLLEITDLNVDDDTNTISFDANGTDADNDITGYSAFVTTSNGETIDLTIDSDGKANQEITTVGAYNKLTVTVTNNDDETTTKETDIDLTVEAPEQPLLLEITDLNVNDTTNTISFDANGTDADNDITGYTAFVTTTNGETIDLTIDSDGKVNQEITTVGAYNKLTVTVTNNDDETTTKETDIDLTVEAPNTAPTIMVTLNNFDEHTPIGTVVGNVAGNDAEGNALTYTIIEGSDKFELNGTNIQTTGTFDFEDAQNTHTIKVAVTDGEFDAQDTDTAEELDSDETPEIVDLEDATYTRYYLGGTVTEDLSYTSTNNANGTPIEIMVDVADNDPNNTNFVHKVLNGFNNSGNPIYTNKETKKQEILAMTYGDALQLSMADSYANGSYGFDGFTSVTVTENGHTGQTVINQHGETVSLEGYRKGIQIIREYLGVADQAFWNAPNTAPNSGNNTVENWWRARAYAIEFAKKMQQPGANNTDTMISRGAEAMARITNMTDDQLRNVTLTVTSIEATETYWDKK